jgi:hypothetical protein
MDTGPIIILANDQKCCYYQSSIQYIARIITTILHHNRDTTHLLHASPAAAIAFFKLEIHQSPTGEHQT